ncbi:MAG: hypothetical protein ACPL7K_08685, partial [Armatimonadota bacterium]
MTFPISRPNYEIVTAKEPPKRLMFIQRVHNFAGQHMVTLSNFCDVCRIIRLAHKVRHIIGLLGNGARNKRQQAYEDKGVELSLQEQISPG